jgi:hypothetical protein
VVNPLRVTEPMVGWKWAPLSAVASCLLVLISVFMLCALKWNNECMHVCIHLRLASILTNLVMCMYLSP